MKLNLECYFYRYSINKKIFLYKTIIFIYLILQKLELLNILSNHDLLSVVSILDLSLFYKIVMYNMPTKIYETFVNI